MMHRVGLALLTLFALACDSPEPVALEPDFALWCSAPDVCTEIVEDLASPQMLTAEGRTA